MKQLDALRIIKTKSWYSPEIYLSVWPEYHMTRYAILTPTDVIGWGSIWEKAIEDADKQQARKPIPCKVCKGKGIIFKPRKPAAYCLACNTTGIQQWKAEVAK